MPHRKKSHSLGHLPFLMIKRVRVWFALGCFDPEVLAELKKSTKKKKEKKETGDKKPKKCGLCGGLGHNRRKCPTLEKTPEETPMVKDGDTYERMGLSTRSRSTHTQNQMEVNVR